MELEVVPENNMISFNCDGKDYKRIRVYYNGDFLKSVIAVHFKAHARKNGLFKFQLKVNRYSAMYDEVFQALLKDNPDYVEILYASNSEE